MKNRRFAIIAFIAIAILLMGVGYAAISRNLQISGSAHVSAVTLAEFDVTFKETVAIQSADVTNVNGSTAEGTIPTATTNTIETGKHEVTLAVSGFETVGDQLVLNYVVEYSTLKEGIDAQLTTPNVVVNNTNPDTDDNDYFSAVASFASSTLTAAQPTTILTVTISLDAVPADATFTSITVTFTAKPVSNA